MKLAKYQRQIAGVNNSKTINNMAGVAAKYTIVP